MAHSNDNPDNFDKYAEQALHESNYSSLSESYADYDNNDVSYNNYENKSYNANNSSDFTKTASSIKGIPPNDIEAEQTVLSCMLEDRDALIIALESLKPDDFYRPDNRVIFESMGELFATDTPVDIRTLKARLDEKGVTNQIGGMEYLATIAGMFYMSSNIKAYVKIIEKRSILRKFIKASDEIASLCYENKEPVEVIIDEAEKKIFNIVQNRSSDGFSHIRDVLISVIEKMELVSTSNSKIIGLSTGFIDLDYKTSGLQSGDLILIAARPSMGKTAFALNIALHVAKKENTPVAIFSLEMSEEQLANRLLSTEGKIDAQNMRTGNMSSDELQKYVNATGVLGELPIYIYDTPGVSPMDIRATCRRLKLEQGLGLIVIDYLQLMSGNGRNDSRQQEISEISRSLKALAREMDAPVIALSQLSRACETRPNHRPILSDLRESGAIEQDADLVSFLYRDEYYNPDTEKKGVAELIIAKQRNGPIGTIDLAWLGKYTAFGNLDKQNSFG